LSRRYRINRGPAALIVIIAVGAWGVLAWLRTPDLTPELRGHDVASRLGCFACHGPGGTGGVPNPGSDEKEVPAWDGGTAMMYVQSEAEIREWILDGHPARLAAEYDSVRARQLPVPMPAYRGVIDDDDLDDIVAYYRVAANYPKPPPEVRDGYRVAARLGCFGCHGVGGLVGAKNPRSFKGYIPPWRGGDFEELVKNDGELEQWILDGSIDRLESNALARWFLRRQVVEMPAYRDLVSDDELAQLVRYIEWLQEKEEP
jgi:mono/diheme cytochrome c family protein